ncbi:MAG: AAA family ATPase [Chloroflexi bacterium]|nr:AAA family ATPase [Chloroflexota bacterium]
MTLRTIRVSGFKSIADQALDLGQLNVFIGGNGAGKSNLIDVFKFLGRLIRGELATYTGQSGGANALLHFGRKRTPSLHIEIVFTDGQHENTYKVSLIPTNRDGFIFSNESTFLRDTSTRDSFIFSDESTYFRDVSRFDEPYSSDTWSGHREAKLPESITPVAAYVRARLESYRIYHFHDTSSSAPPKQSGDIADNRFLRPDAGNLAAFLFRMQSTQPDHFRSIVDTIQQIAPFFGRFILGPSALNLSKIQLEWEELGSDTYFSPDALSDGTLRFMCLATLLLQPKPPSIILIDEPELGLHPAAIQLLASMLQSAATRSQLIVATQSVTLINQLEPEQVWIVNRDEGASVFRHLASEDISSWLDDYSLGDLWEKNVLQGRP